MFLARSVTGSYRAVKVVRREDFERERTFEREFEGIQHYEKLSKDHPGLVDVLHVGRNDKAGYYYYVMELADDVEAGAEIDVDTYAPRTLASDLKQHRLRPVPECVAVGALLAEALGHLHASGLTHRDIKPSNIIFVKGVAKLADVGLVASSGQRTYVGTEGYVPPEGPGTAAADLYSLAMVLYEMSTGKDRLEFPELPTNMELPPTLNRDEWRSLNLVICRGGAPDPRRRFENGEALAAALRRVTQPAASPASSWGRGAIAAAAIVLAAALGAGGISAWRLAFSPEPPAAVPEPAPPADPAALAQALPEETGPAPAPPDNGVAPGGQPLSLPPSGQLADAFADGVPPQPLFPGATGSGGPVSIPGISEFGGIVITDMPKPPPLPLVADDAPLPPPQSAWLKITQPTGASVWHEGKFLAVTPTDYLEFEPGEVRLALTMPGFHERELVRELPPGVREIEGELQLLPDRSPREGEAWENSAGLAFAAVGRRHISERPISLQLFQRFLQESAAPFSLAQPAGQAGASAPAGAAPGPPAAVDEGAMWAFSDWMTERDRAEGYLGRNHFHHPQPDSAGEGPQAFFSRVEDRFGAIQVNSEPTGAAVRRGETLLGVTPLTLESQRIGPASLTLSLPGYRETVAEIAVQPSDIAALTVPLSRDDSVLFGEPWSNSLGMRFVPVEDFMASVYETRVADYEAFLADSPAGIEPPLPGFPQKPDHPVAGVNLLEARAFCLWLTEKERVEGLIQPYHEYRVPADLQWSAMAGLSGEEGETPAMRDIRKVQDHFPWGEEWPPPPGAGNFADETAGATLPGSISGYDDGHEKTAPAGSFLPNDLGIHDLAGNVWEWIDEGYNGEGSRLYLVRGGGWDTFQRANLLTSYRKALSPEYKRGGAGEHGFRCVLVDTRGQPEPPAAPALAPEP